MKDLIKALKEASPDFYSAVVVIDYLGRVLLGKRHEDGFWTSPAGGGHYPESPVKCAIRELFEESGIVARPEDLTLLEVVGTRNQKECHVFYMTVVPGISVTSRLDPDQEIKKWGWYSKEEIPKDLIKDERRHTSVRMAYMHFHRIAKGGAGSGIVGHTSFHESERNRHYEEGLKIQETLNNIEDKIKDRKRIDPSYKVPSQASEVIKELKNRRDEHSNQFKVHNDKHSQAMQKDVDAEAALKRKKAEARSRMSKSDLAVDLQGSSIETSNYSLDSANAGDKWLEIFLLAMTGIEYGDMPRDIQLDLGHYISLVKTDDGIYSGVVRATMNSEGENLETNVFKLEKQTIPTIIQALKAKEYILPSINVPEPVAIMEEPALNVSIQSIETSEMSQLRRKLEAVKLILEI